MPDSSSLVCARAYTCQSSKVTLPAYAHLGVYIALPFKCAGDGDRGRDRDRGGFFGRRDGSQDGSEGGMDDGPSRADAVDDWGASRKFVPTDKTSSFGSGGGFGGGGGFKDRRDEPRDEGEDAGKLPSSPQQSNVIQIAQPAFANDGIGAVLYT